MKNITFASFAILVLGFASISSATDWCHEYAKKKDYDNQVKACTEAIESKRPNPHIDYTNRGIGYAHKGLLDQALADFNTAL